MTSISIIPEDLAECLSIFCSYLSIFIDLHDFSSIDSLDYDEISFERKENEKYEAMKGPDFD